MRKLAIVALVSALLTARGVFAQQKAGKDGVYEELNFFDEAFERIRQDSVDSVSDTKLIDAAISGMLTGLDPRSSFLDEAEQKLRAPANSEVALTLRRGNGAPIDLKMKREPFKLQTVTGRVEGSNIGYLRVAGFDGTTQTALAATVQDLRQRSGNKLIGFILDLRNNPGGNFDAAVATPDALIDEGDIVVR